MSELRTLDLQTNGTNVLLDDEFVDEGLTELGSYNHSYLQARLASLFFLMEGYTPFTELSLDLNSLDDEILSAKFKNTIKPDVSVYSERSIDVTDDQLQMTEMPLLAIEILSPMQGVQTLLDKMKVYFALGVPSCWLVYPSVRTIAVFTTPKDFTSYNDGDVVDETLGIRVPLTEIFG